MCNIRIFIAEIGIGLLPSWKTKPRFYTLLFRRWTLLHQFCKYFLKSLDVNFVQYSWCVQFIQLSILSNLKISFFLAPLPRLKISLLYSQTQSTLFGVAVPTSISIILTRLQSQFCGLGGNLPIFVGRHFWIIGSSSRWWRNRSEEKGVVALLGCRRKLVSR